MNSDPLLDKPPSTPQPRIAAICFTGKLAGVALVLYIAAFSLPHLLVYETTCKPKIAFDKSLGSHMVLQQAPAISSVYGTVSSLGDCALKVVLVGPDNKMTELEVELSGTVWTAELPVTRAGGSYTIAASAGAVSVKLDDVVFGDVWYCGGQSNMALPLENTLSRNKSKAAIESGKYEGIRIMQVAGNMNPALPWKSVAKAIKDGTFMKFSSTCYYFGESLVDQVGSGAPAIGLIHTAFGGSTIQQWLPNSTIFECGHVENNQGRFGTFFDNRILPFSRMSIKGWVWYQGENNMHDFFGNSMNHTGYACLIVKLVDLWRRTWSLNAAVPHDTTPFGIVALPNSGSEGGNDVGSMRIAQTGSFGFLPNKDIPHSFLAQTYDLNDPFVNTSCYRLGCCNPSPKAKNCNGCTAYCRSTSETNFYMGPIHSRVKKPVGQRLARGYLGLSGSKSGYARGGPTFKTCKRTGPKQLSISFDESWLAKDKLILQKYDVTVGSQLEVLVNKSAFCMQTVGRGGTKCLDDGNGFSKGPGRYDDTRHTWISVDISLASSTTIAVDLSKTDGVAYAIRYGWGDCCHPRPATSLPCPLEACPVMTQNARLPANPFIAKIVNDRCECLPPLSC